MMHRICHVYYCVIYFGTPYALYSTLHHYMANDRICYYMRWCTGFPRCIYTVWYNSVHPTPYTLHSTIIWRIRYVFHCMIWCTGISVYTTVCVIIRCAIIPYILHPVPYAPPLYGGLDMCSTVWYDVLEFPCILLCEIWFGVLSFGTPFTPYPTPHHYMAN